MFDLFPLVIISVCVLFFAIETARFLYRLREIDRKHKLAMEKIDIQSLARFEELGQITRFFVPDDDGSLRLYVQTRTWGDVTHTYDRRPRKYKLKKKQLFQLELAGVINTDDKKLAYTWARKLKLDLPPNPENLFGPIV